MPSAAACRLNAPSVGFARIWISPRHCERERSNPEDDASEPDCFVATLLAMTLSMRRLFILLALLLAPTLAHARGIEPELVAEGPAPPGGEVDLAIHMRPAAGWHGYWLNPGDAGLPMDVKWQLPRGFSAGPLRYPVPSRLTVADLMNYVYERDYAVLVRLKVPADAQGHDRDPGRRALARLHRQDLRARAGATRARLAGRQRNPEPRAVRRVAACLAAAAGDGRPFRKRWRQVARRDPAPGERQRRRALRLSRSPTRWSITRRSRASAALATCSSPSSSARARRPRNSPACWRSATGEGSSFAPCPELCPSDGTPIGGLGREADPVGGARRARRRHPAQPDALRLPDPRAEGVAPVARRQRRGARAVGCARLHCGRGRRHGRARRGPACPPRWRDRRGLGVPAAGPADDHASAPACRRDHAQPAARVRIADTRRTGAAGRELRHRRARRVRRDTVRRTVPRRGAWEPRCCCRWPAPCWCSRRSGFGLALPFLLVAFVPVASGTGCRSPAPGWRGCSAFSPFRWRRAPWRPCGCSIGWAASRRSLRDLAWTAMLLALLRCVRLRATPGAERRRCRGDARAGVHHHWRSQHVPQPHAGCGERPFRRRAVERGARARVTSSRANPCSSISPPTGA